MTAADVEQITFEEIVFGLDTPWVIKILDDDVTPMNYVVAVFMKHFKLTEELAITRMMQVHEEGSATLDSGTEEEMLVHHEAMRHYKLRSSVEKAN